MLQPERLKQISFDLYERYVLLDRIGAFFRPSTESFRVLDVGGHTEAFWQGFPSMAGALIPDASVTVVDMLPSAELRNYVRASGVRLPFRDGAFDFVCSFDTLEHIPAEHRPAFVNELMRVTRNGLYMAFPFDSESNGWAESLVRQYTDVSLKLPIPALLEHRQFGLPDRTGIDHLFSTSSYPWISFQQGNTDVWLLMMLTYHSLRVPGTDFVEQLNRRFNQTYAAQDWGEPAYRAAYLMSKCRNAGELEALRASLVPSQKSADLQSVLAMCQLFLSIAQNARAGVDKDRHIHNLEQQLTEIRDLASYQKLSLDGRIRDLELRVVTNKRAIQAIYDSRIWKALCNAGSLLMRLAGQRPAPDAAWGGPSVQPAEHPVSRFEADDEFIGLVCDYPGGDKILSVRDVVEISGWTLARSGISRVTVQINDETPGKATYGIARPDVARGHPERADAESCGYRYIWDTTGLPEALCTIRITAVSRNGKTREIVCKARIDWKTPPDYSFWIKQHEPALDVMRQIRFDSGNLPLRPLISIAVPVYKTPPALLTRCIESVLEQTYPKWELCLVDDGSDDATLTALLEKFARNDDRIRVFMLPRNRGISGATNEALRHATGEYVAFLDHDDELAGFALAAVVQAINDSPETDIFYSDEDKIDVDGRRYDAFFKPDWSPDLLRSCNYVCHLLVMKRALLARLGGLNEDYSGAQDYELLLRASEHTQKIKRIPHVLYHWRAIPGSTAMAVAEKPAASADGKRALSAYLERTARGATVEEVGECRYRVRYPIIGNPPVSILIPTGGNRMAFRAVEDVVEKTDYKNFEILLIDNSRAGKIEEFAAGLAARPAPLRYINWRGKPFNFAQMNNEAAKMTDSPYLLFLNDDTSVISSEWLGALLEHAQRPGTGAVGAQLWFPNNLIQHAGVVMGIFGNCSHAFKGLPGGHPHYFDFPNLIRNCSAVTGACLMVAREKFFQAGAFDEVNLAVAFQDVDFCLKLLEIGYRNVYTPYAKLYHHESATKTDRDKIPDPVEDAFMKKKWAKYIADDPYYNPNLARRKEDFSLAV